MDVEWVEPSTGRSFAFGASQPRLGQDVWVAPGAVLIGDYRTTITEAGRRQLGWLVWRSRLKRFERARRHG
jgi:hypothetical protein